MIRRGILFSLIVILLFTYAYAINLTNGLGDYDEGWFLQVVARYLSGDLLYREVFLGVTPLSVYLTAVLVSIVGVEITVIRAVNALCFVLTVLFGWQIAHQLKLNKTVFTLAMLVYAFPSAIAVYSPLATACLMACLALTLMCNHDKRSLLFFVIGISAGLTFTSKQNMGLFALAASGFSVIASVRGVRTDELLKSILWIGAGFTLTVGLLLMPMVVTDSLSAFWDYGFVNKSSYLERSSISYSDQVQRLFSDLSPLTIERLHILHVDTFYLIAPITLAALVHLFIKNYQNQTRYIVLLFAGAGFLSIFPRSDPVHMRIAVPVLLIAAAYVWRCYADTLSRIAHQTIKYFVIWWLFLGLTFYLVPRINKIFAGELQVSNLSHFHGVLMPRVIYEFTDEQIRQLATRGERDPIMLVLPNAGFYYLVTGLHNPTPFDFPLSTAFGTQGLTHVIDQLRSGTIAAVCYKSTSLYDFISESLRPLPLESFITENMHSVQDYGICMEYRLPQ